MAWILEIPQTYWFCLVTANFLEKKCAIDQVKSGYLWVNQVPTKNLKHLKIVVSQGIFWCFLSWLVLIKKSTELSFNHWVADSKLVRTTRTLSSRGFLHLSSSLFDWYWSNTDVVEIFSVQNNRFNAFRQSILETKDILDAWQNRKYQAYQTTRATQLKTSSHKDSHQNLLSRLCDQLNSTHLHNSSNPARPYRCRLINFNFVTCPSVWALLHATLNPALTARKSRCNPSAKRSNSITQHHRWRSRRHQSALECVAIEQCVVPAWEEDSTILKTF